MIAPQARDLPRVPCTVLVLLLVGSACVVASCGGGGGASGCACTPQNPLQSAQAPSLPIHVPSTTLKATDSSGNTWTATYSSTAGGTTTVNGQVAYGTTTFFTATRGATVLDSEHMTEYALMNPYSPLSRTIYFDSLPGRLSPGSITSYDPLPSTLTAGASGSLRGGPIFSDTGISGFLAAHDRREVHAKAETEPFCEVQGASGA